MPEPYILTAFNLSEPSEPEAAGLVDPPAFHLDDLGQIDLTQYSEERFTPGVSSEGGPLGE